jgi:hypothetical protein
MKRDFRTTVRLALIGAAIAFVYGAVTKDQWTIGGDDTARLVGQLLGYAVGGALLGAITSLLLPRQKP